MWCTGGIPSQRSAPCESWRSCGGRPVGPLVAARRPSGSSSSSPDKTMKREELPMADVTMPGMDVIRKQLVDGDGDLLRELVSGVVAALMSAEADAICGATYGERSPERVNSRNGYRPRRWDTRAGTIDLEIPKLREGSYYPHWLLEPRSRSERALVSVVADLYLAGVSTRRVDKVVRQLGIQGMSKSQVSRLAGELDEIVEGFRTRPLDMGPYPYLMVDALVVKVREGG